MTDLRRHAAVLVTIVVVAGTAACGPRPGTAASVQAERRELDSEYWGVEVDVTVEPTISVDELTPTDPEAREVWQAVVDTASALERGAGAAGVEAQYVNVQLGLGGITARIVLDLLGVRGPGGEDAPDQATWGPVVGPTLTALANLATERFTGATLAASIDNSAFLQVDTGPPATPTAGDPGWNQLVVGHLAGVD